MLVVFGRSCNLNSSRLRTRRVCFRIVPSQGDDRVNEQTMLAVIHTLWMREHNRIESKLHRINPDWNGETLFQETRRIVAAMIQQITYSEFLPVILGPQTVAKYDLKLLKGSQYYQGQE